MGKFLIRRIEEVFSLVRNPILEQEEVYIVVKTIIIHKEKVHE
jgi:hypothetical protein